MYVEMETDSFELQALDHNIYMEGSCPNKESKKYYCLGKKIAAISVITRDSILGGRKEDEHIPKSA